jgi:NAD(P)-dependent dehydrogenase (short-subunit alcohol dehydrogenase family)
MAGKTVVITGATSGIGEVAADRLAGKGERIVFIARDRARGQETLKHLRAISDGDHTAHYADLSRLSEMKRVAGEIAQTEPQIDILINNAGAMFNARKVTEDGLEKTFALNHMAYFVLTSLRSSISRICSRGATTVVLASMAARSSATFSSRANSRGACEGPE